jgi:hypothetical protein
MRWRGSTPSRLRRAGKDRCHELCWHRHCFLPCLPLPVVWCSRVGAGAGYPTVGDVVPGFETSQWYGISAPRTHPPRSSISSTKKSTRPSLTPRRGPGFSIWGHPTHQFARRFSASLSRSHRQAGQGGSGREPQARMRLDYRRHSMSPVTGIARARRANASCIRIGCVARPPRHRWLFRVKGRRTQSEVR